MGGGLLLLKCFRIQRVVPAGERRQKTLFRMRCIRQSPLKFAGVVQTLHRLCEGLALLQCGNYASGAFLKNRVSGATGRQRHGLRFGHSGVEKRCQER